jgi:hypothetical protein
MVIEPYIAQNGKCKISVLFTILKEGAGKSFLWDAFMHHT